ncbi:SusC/RagA family TonB-linked outer membrane protein [Arachidicoccus soli]|uniref:SusC/RagA family TonB-linked outer membrane protein n=1 Tax=Arachidicoccus soli TaxID=2341117 RepID=A0A386HU27_9BACT|nr:SusC/RagA family TonB-linked outer membrane protein [Arachidicoccus soli]AYD49182.1 SusC/RagA family TonB-linked outer membrane protein [Arachidicoccus soli]
MRQKLLLLLCFGMFLFAGKAFSQDISVSGTVKNAKGEAIAAASILVKGTKQGAITNSQGEFSLKVKNGDYLVISAISYETQTVKVNSSEMDVILKEQDAALTEVVVTALGRSLNKAKIGYSTIAFTADQISKNAPVGLLDNLAGKVPGAQISNIGGPGSSTKVILRGYGAIAGGSNAPLLVIDGVPLANNSPAGSDNTDFGNGINDINPDDVESENFLLGTAATAIYGSLAKNGAIIITTKQGKAGNLKIAYNGGINFSKVGKLPKMQDQFGNGWGFEFIPGENGSWGPKLDGVVRPWGSVVDNSQLIKPFSFINNNIRDFYTTGVEGNNNVSLSGGNEHNRFYFSYGNVSSNGVIPTQSDLLQRNTFSIKTNTNYGKFSFNSFFNYINRKQNAPNTGQASANGGGVFESLLQIPVDLPIKDFQLYKNKFFNVDNYFTPYAENPYYGLNENGDQQRSDRLLGNLEAKYEFTPSFSALYRLGGDFENTRTQSWNQPNAPASGSWNGPNPTNTEGATRKVDPGSYEKYNQFYGTINMDFIVEYKHDLSNTLNLDIIGGGNYYQNSYEATDALVTNLVIPGFFNLSNSNQPPTATGSTTRSRSVGLYSQATLAFKNQLYLTGNVRNDWFSTLPIEKNSVFYPGANLSWVASNTFDLSNSSISYLKLRAAYGVTGSAPSAYQTYNVLNATNIGLGFGSLTSPFNGVSSFLVSNNIPNSQLKPIITKELEGGFEIKALHDRIGLDATFYHRITQNQIFQVPVAPSTGYTTLVQNLGHVRNQGIEIAFNATPIKSNNFEWNINYSFAKNWNKVLDLTGGSPNPILNTAYDAELRAVVGKSVAEIYAPTPQLSPSGQIVVSPTTGFPLVNTTPNTADNNITKRDYGSALYKYTMGFYNSWRYKDVSFDFALDYRFGGVMYSGTSDLLNFVGNAYNTTYNERKPFIVPNSVVANTDGSGKTTYSENTIAIPSEDMYDYYYPTKNPALAYDSRIISKSFLKLRSVNLSYSLPSTWANGIRVNKILVGIYAKNLLLWTPASNAFVDPEATNYGTDLNGELGEFRTAPLEKEFGFVLKVLF